MQAFEHHIRIFGQIFSKDGTHPDSKRVEDLLNAPQSTNVHEVRKLLGMANYSSKYIQDYATIMAPLRELTKKNVKFKWTYQQQQAFVMLYQKPPRWQEFNMLLIMIRP